MPKVIKEDVIFDAGVTFNLLPKVWLGSFFAGDTTPSILSVTVFKSPGSATTVTNFDNGAEGQTIRILGNGNLTVSNNTTIKTNTGANKVLAANKIYEFTLVNAIWYEAE
jgi:hypothetical protein